MVPTTMSAGRRSAEKVNNPRRKMQGQSINAEAEPVGRSILSADVKLLLDVACHTVAHHAKDGPTERGGKGRKLRVFANGHRGS